MTSIRNLLFIYVSLVSLFFISCSKKSAVSDVIPKHETFTINSKIVNETRVINVWTPDLYADGNTRLPVIYMADGGIKEDFPHIANTLNELIAAKKIPAFMLVGIENTQRRRDLTPVTELESDKEIAPEVGGSQKFRDFIREELIPEINKRYRTTEMKGILGESLSGLFVIETMMLEPDLFDYYIAFDPSLWWNNHHLADNVHKYLANKSNKRLRLWFAGSSAKDIQIHTRHLSEQLKGLGNRSITWNYSDEPKEKHHTIFRATKEKALIWTLNP